MNLDLDNLAIGYFKLGDEFQGKDQVFEAAGYSVSVHKNRIVNIHVNFETKIPKSSPFKDTVIYEGKALNISVNSGFQDIERIFGPPDEQWEDDYAKSYRYRFKNYELEFNWLVDTIHFEYLSVDLVEDFKC